MQGYHITITELSTGHVFVDQDTVAILGAIDDGEAGTIHISCRDCDMGDWAATITGAQVIVNEVMADLPADIAERIKEVVSRTEIED